MSSSRRYADLYGRLQVDSIDGDSIPIALVHYEKGLQNNSAVEISVYRIEIKTEEDEKKKKGDRRAYECVSIPALHAILYQAVLRCTGQGDYACLRGIRDPHACLVNHSRGHGFLFAICLVCLGQFVFGLLPNLWMQLAMAYNSGTNQLNLEDAARLVVFIYASKYERARKRRAVHGGTVCQD